MPGKWITNKQVKIYMQSRVQGHTQEVSAAKSDISVKSGRAIEQGKRKSPKNKERRWRTRKDPLATVWESELAPMLERTPDLQAITLLEYLQSEYPWQYEDKILRTLQRRVKMWRALQGPEQEVFFRQHHEPGQQGLSDFTTLKRATITIAGQKFKHLLYHFRLIYSKWSYMKVVVGGESYTALAEGLQEALMTLGGAPYEHRTDSLSAAFKNLTRAEQDDVTESYASLCTHYRMKPSRNNRGKGHENGGVESPHGHLKRRIEQALLLRGSNDFVSVESYQNFIHEVVKQHDHRNATSIKMEKAALQTLPEVKAVDYKLVQAVVSSSSTIDVRKVTYTVPSRLQGETLQVRLYDNRLVCYLGCHHVITLNRIYPIGKTTRARQVDYRHVIHSLIKKPQAFRYSQIRDDLLPSHHYKIIWQYINRSMEAKAACRLMVGLLYLAATQNCERALSEAVLSKIESADKISLCELEMMFNPSQTVVPVLSVQQHTLHQYNDLIISTEEVCHV